MEDPIQKHLAEFIANCDMSRIDEKFKADARLRVLDWLGCAIAGAHYPQMKIAGKLAASEGGAEEATAIGVGAKIPAKSAAFMNGIAGHVCELDDGHRTAIGHPGSITVPVALALGEKIGASGADFLKAVILGYDMFTRLGRTVNPSHYRTWHSTGTVGTVAAAAAAASILKLNAEEANNALGLAATMAGGLIESFGSHAKALNIAKACECGVLAAELAQLGFTGSHSAITGKKGFIAATCTDPHPEHLENPSEATLVSDTAFFKKYSSCGHTNSPLDALCALMKAHPEIRPDTVKSIRVKTYRVSVDITSALKCSTEDEAKFSLPYCFAVQIAFGRVGLKQFSPEVRSDEKILNLARRVEVVEDPEATALFPRRVATVEVELVDGTRLTEKRLNASDEADASLVEAKFMEAAESIGEAASRDLVEIVRRIDELENLESITAVLSKL